MFGLKTNLFGQELRAHRQETGGVRGAAKKTKPSGLATGLVAGTMVATAMGWRLVEAIAKGDMVLTFDRGLQPVRALTRGVHWDRTTPCPNLLWPLKVPAGALGNQDAMTLLPEQCVMVESDTAEMLFGDPFTLLNGADLAGFRAIKPAAPDCVLDVIQLHFDDDEVVFANAGALVFCPSLRVINMAELLAARPDTAPYTPLPADEAAMLIECLVDEDAVSIAPSPGTAGPLQYAACA